MTGFSVEIDHLVLGVMIVPADKTMLSPPRVKRNFDVRSGFGIDGAFCVYTGQGLASFDATFEFWNAEKEAAWDQWASLVLPPPSRTPVALSIYHPVLAKAPFNIQGVVVTEVEGWSLISPGRWQTRLSFLEYRAPKPFVPNKTEPAIPALSVPVERPKTAQDHRTVASKERLKAAVSRRL